MCAQAEVNKRNIDILVEEIKNQRGAVATLSEDIKRSLNTIAILQAELANTKAMTAHMLGRGTGPTA
tara:strand:- start:26734 stop:26934 length:201 start_codon:yes stop_codon:yes gene_type:complete